MLYKSTLFKVKDNAISDLHYTFYSNLENCQVDNDIRVIYPAVKYKFNTATDSLKNRIFIVQDIVDKNGNSFVSSSNNDNPIFVLKDTITQQLIYYKYDERYDQNFFHTTKIVFDEKVLCEKIKRRVDDFTGAINLNSPISNDLKIASMIIYKEISKTKTTYYLNLSTIGNTAVVNGTGATILFTDGTKWTKPVKIDVRAGNTGFDYSASITLTQADLNTLATKTIKKYRLYIFDEEINLSDADKFKIYLKCIKEAK